MTKRTDNRDILVVGRDVDGKWTVRVGAGVLLGRFASGEAARRFARLARRGCAAVPIATSAGAAPRIKGRLTLRSGRDARTGSEDA